MFIWRIIRTGLKYIWKTINTVRIITLNLVFFFILFMVIGLSGSNISPQSGILVLDIEGVLVDSTNMDPNFYQLSRKLSGNKVDPARENNLFEITQKIDQAATDPNIKGIVLKLDNFDGGSLPSLEYLAKYLKKFKATGKPIYAYGSSYNQKQYYLASLANKIYLSNFGSVELYGLAANNFYFKSLLDNLKIKTHVFRVGTYKSAVEPYIRNDMSKEAKENTRRWLTSMWKNYLTDISDSRGKPTDSLSPNANTLIERLKAVSGNMTEYALENNIVDTVVSDYEFEQEMHSQFKTSDSVSIYDYQLNAKAMQSFEPNSPATHHKPLIAVVFVNGTISQGNSSEMIVGSNSITKQLRALGNDKSVRAVVLRINSPGGSVNGSEEIRSELAALREKDIPVVVSMGGMAASGGYWIATESDYIYSSANTITGSIGIFGILPNFEGTLNNIGINSDGVSTSPLAGVTMTKEIPEQFSQLMQMSVNNGYDNFLSIVSQARNMNYDDVDKIAQGQVWLGEEALKIGLVDEIGDIDNAIQKAATIAGVSDYTVTWQKQEADLFSSILNNYSAILPNTLTQLIYNELPAAKQFKEQITIWNSLNKAQNRYVYCLSCADVK
jgi:signal peptide peptidase SppA, 67K type